MQIDPLPVVIRFPLMDGSAENEKNS